MSIYAQVKNDPFLKQIAQRFGYRKHRVRIVPIDAVTLHDLNWSGGTRYSFTALDLETLATAGKDHSRLAPWDNPAEGKTVPLEPGVAVVCTGVFCGKTATMTIYIHPDNAAKLIPAQEA